jgi:hypothetical protein
MKEHLLAGLEESGLCHPHSASGCNDSQTPLQLGKTSQNQQADTRDCQTWS